MKIPYYDHEESSALLVNYLRPKKVLLVLDNFEHLIPGANLLAQIAADCPGVKMMVTSRKRLNLRAERRFPVEGLDYPPDGETDVQIRYSAVDLFTERARREIPDYAISDEDYSDVIRICQVLDGLPLGIELAAAWIDTISASEILNEISRNLDFLQGSVSRHALPPPKPAGGF